MKEFMGLVAVFPALEICESDTCEAMLATWESALILYCPTVLAVPFCKVWVKQRGARAYAELATAPAADHCRFLCNEHARREPLHRTAN